MRSAGNSKKIFLVFLIAFAVAGTASAAKAECKNFTLKAYGYNVSKNVATMDAFGKWHALAKTRYGPRARPANGDLKKIKCKRQTIRTKRYNPLTPGYRMSLKGYRCTAAARPCY